MRLFNLLLPLLLIPFHSFAANENFVVESQVTLRELVHNQDHLVVLGDLPVGSEISFDMTNHVGRTRYQTSTGIIKTSSQGWYRGIFIDKHAGGKDVRNWNSKILYISVSHLDDLRGDDDRSDIDVPGSAICQKISKSNSLKKSKIGVGTNHGLTQYFTPRFPDLTSKHQGKSYRYWCLNIEGSCIVDDTLWNYPNLSYRRKDITCKYGFGNGRGSFNTTNCLNPCRTIAADQSKHKAGTVVYIPGMRGRLCPHTGQPVDGCFIVGDVGSAIKGRGRFDLFTGVCRDYDAGRCLDNLHSQYLVPKGSTFYYLNRSNSLSKELRQQNDQHVNGSGF